MSRRSKYIVAVIIVMQPFSQILNLMYITGGTDPDTNGTYCQYTPVDEARIIESLHMCLAIAILFLVIITFNLATIAVLCRNRFRQLITSGNRDHVLVFTKITIMTCVSFVISYFLELYSGAFLLRRKGSRYVAST